MPINLSTLVDQTNSLQLAKAWVNFNGTTATPSTIRSSYNVSSITKNGTGDYTVNFATAMVDANYSAVVSVQAPINQNVAISVNSSAGPVPVAPSTSAVRFTVASSPASSGFNQDTAFASVQIFGN